MQDEYCLIYLFVNLCFVVTFIGSVNDKTFSFW